MTGVARGANVIPTLLALVLIGAAAASNFSMLTRDTFTFDEALTFSRAHHDLATIFADEGNPANTLKLKAWLLVTGYAGMTVDGLWLLRLPNFLLYLAGAGFMFWWAHRLGGPVAAVASGLVAAFSPELMDQAAVARYYPLLFLMCLALLFVLYEGRHWRRSTRLGALAFIVATGWATHALFVLFLAGAAVFLFLGLALDNSRSLRRRAVAAVEYLCVLFPAALLYAVLYPGLLRRLRAALSDTGNGSGEPAVAATGPEGEALFLTPARWWEIVHQHLAPGGNVVMAVVLLSLALAGAVWAWRRRRFLCVLLAGAFLFPLPFAFLAVDHHEWAARYILPIVAPLAVFAGLGAAAAGRWAIWRLPRRRAAGAPEAAKRPPSRVWEAAIAVLALCVGVPLFAFAETVRDTTDPPAYRYTAWRAVAEDVEAHLGADDELVFGPYVHFHWRNVGFVRCYFEDHVCPYPRARPVRPFTHYADPETFGASLADRVEDAADRGVGLWLLTSHPRMMYMGLDTAALAVDAALRDLDAAWLVHRNEWVRLFEANAAPVQQARIVEESAFADGAPGLRWDQGASAQTLDNRARVVFLEVSHDAPLDIADGRPMPTVWFTPSLAEAGGRLARAEEAQVRVTFDAKWRDVREGMYPVRNLSIILWADEHGVWHNDVVNIRRSRDWTQITAWLPVAEAIRADPESLQIGLGNRGGSGEIWIDNVRIDLLTRGGEHAPAD